MKRVGQQGGVCTEQKMGPQCVVAGHGLVSPVTGMVSACTLPWLLWVLSIDSEESWTAVDILLPLAASAAIAGAGALVAGSVTRGVAGQPAADRTHAELKNDLKKTGEIYVHTCGCVSLIPDCMCVCCILHVCPECRICMLHVNLPSARCLS